MLLRARIPSRCRRQNGSLVPFIAKVVKCYPRVLMLKRVKRLVYPSKKNESEGMKASPQSQSAFPSMACSWIRCSRVLVSNFLLTSKCSRRTTMDQREDLQSSARADAADPAMRSLAKNEALFLLRKPVASQYHAHSSFLWNRLSGSESFSPAWRQKFAGFSLA